MQALEEPTEVSRHRRDTSRTSLERIFEQNPRSSSNSQSKRVPQLIPFYSGGGGGVGVTTIMGTLARHLSGRGDRVLLIDGEANSTLGFLFSGAPCPEGESSFAAEALPSFEAHLRGRVDIFCRPAALANNPRAENAEAWGWKAIAEMGAEVDRVFIDIWPGMTDRSESRILGSGNPLVVIAPDLRCVLGISRLTTLFATLEQSLGRSIMPCFLLNLLDLTLPFEVEMLNRLKELLGNRLIPMFIPRSGEIPEAAAEGMTIMDFNPECAAAKSFHYLAEWIENQRPVEPVNLYTTAQTS